MTAGRGSTPCPPTQHRMKWFWKMNAEKLSVKASCADLGCVICDGSAQQLAHFTSRLTRISSHQSSNHPRFNVFSPPCTSCTFTIQLQHALVSANISTFRSCVFAGSHLCLNPVHRRLQKDFTPRLPHGVPAPKQREAFSASMLCYPYKKKEVFCKTMKKASVFQSLYSKEAALSVLLKHARIMKVNWAAVIAIVPVDYPLPLKGQGNSKCG